MLAILLSSEFHLSIFFWNCQFVFELKQLSDYLYPFLFSFHNREGAKTDLNFGQELGICKSKIPHNVIISVSHFQFIFLNTEHGWKWDSFRGNFRGEECESWWKDIWKRCDFPKFLSQLVTRFVATSMAYNMNMLIDINTDIYPLRANDKFTMVLANTLYKDNRPDPGVYTDYSKEVWFSMFSLKWLEYSDGWLRVLHVWKGIQVSVQGQWKDVGTFELFEL